jgi:hypothetical protein
MNPTQYGKKTATFGQSSHHCPTGFFSGLSLLAIADEVIDSIFRNASIEGGEVTLWVNRVVSRVRPSLPLLTQQRPFVCAAISDAVGHFRTHARQKSWLGAVLVQADALLINHIAPGRRTLAPSA